MKLYDLRSGMIVASLFITFFIVFGAGYDAAGVFFAPMLNDLRWSRTGRAGLKPHRPFEKKPRTINMRI